MRHSVPQSVPCCLTILPQCLRPALLPGPVVLDRGADCACTEGGLGWAANREGPKKQLAGRGGPSLDDGPNTAMADAFRAYADELAANGVVPALSPFSLPH